MRDILEKIYRGRTVLITGHTGFKGSWLAIWLNELGANVIGYALDPLNAKDNFNLANLKDKIVDIRGDIRDSDKLYKVFDEYQPEFVFHLAAQPLVRLSYQQPKYTYEVNVIGTLNVLEAMKATDKTKVGIIITSDKCYENKEWLWGYRENDDLGGFDPYSSSKGCVELLVASYRNSFFNVNKFDEHEKVIATVRAGNVIGGGDWSKDRILPDCISALEINQNIIIRNPKAVRPWQHVLEPLSGYLLLGSNLLQHGSKYSGAWNFGPNPDSIITVEEVVNKIIMYWGKGNWISPDSNLDLDLPHEANLLILDINKVKYVLGWSPKWNIDKALEKTIQWYKNYSSEDVYNICKSQINEYCAI